MISFEDFKKVDIRVGEILSVEEIPNTDKLLLLSVEVGEGRPRKIVSGIREHVPDLSKLVGLKTTFVLNLPPREICGITSEGMLFAVGGEGEFSFLLPESDVDSGKRLI